MPRAGRDRTAPSSAPHPTPGPHPPPPPPLRPARIPRPPTPLTPRPLSDSPSTRSTEREHHADPPLHHPHLHPPATRPHLVRDPLPPLAASRPPPRRPALPHRLLSRRLHQPALCQGLLPHA